jgi:hypothetical protein
MRLYTRTGAIALTDPATGIVYEADEQGGFDFPDDLSDQMHHFHPGGRPGWETDIERQHRLIGEEMERRKDPATLLGVVEQLMRAAQSAGVASVAKQEAPAEDATTPADDGAEAAADEPPAEKTARTPRKTAASRRTAKAE